MFEYFKSILFKRKRLRAKMAKERFEELKTRQAAYLVKRSTGEIKDPLDDQYIINLERDSAHLQQVRGLAFAEDDRNFFDAKARFKISIQENTSKQEIETFLETVPNGFEVKFFDFYHPTISDPGAYVVFQQVNGEFLFLLTNHGWSGKWQKIDPAALVDYIFRNREHNLKNFKISRFYKEAEEGKGIAD